MKNTVRLGIILSGLVGFAACAATPQELLREYATQAKHKNAAFSDFSAKRGEQIFRTKHAVEGKQVSCSTCHTDDPRSTGKTRANKKIEPMAPSVNKERFTDKEKVEKWFKRNCGDVLGRACTAEEKGDFISYLLTVK